MSTMETVALGAIAGLTIFLGLPLARATRFGERTRVFLSGLSAGIVLFLLFEVLEHAGHPLEEAVEEGHWAEAAGFGAVYIGGFAAGLFSLVWLARMWKRRGERVSMGPGAAAVAELTGARTDALRLGMSIAAGIGLHNFSEGLAIGQAAGSGETSLALLLVIGFALHNATEGFGIAAPLAAGGVRASWGWIALAGLIGGGPTFLGTIVGTAFQSVWVFVVFLALAAGALLYVLAELIAAGRRLAWEATLAGLFVGFVAGIGTELVLEAAGL